MHPHIALVQRFYTNFQELDGEGMAQCYHPDIHFSDPVFPELHGAEAGEMWRMLCSQAQDFELYFSDIQCNDTEGNASWEAIYSFSKTGRRVHNRIKASFVFSDGKIIEHHDEFNFWKWSIMALGPVGLMLGWTPFLQNKVRKQAAVNLQKFKLQSSNKKAGS